MWDWDRRFEMIGKRTLYGLAAAAVAGGLLLTGAFAQQDSEPGRIARFLQDSLSAPGRTVRIIGLSGALSSTPSVAEITVADAQGPWLILRDLRVEWRRTALVRRRLDIQSLRAGEIHMERRPIPMEAANSESGGDFSLPLAIAIERIEAPAIVLGQTVAGTAAMLSANGRIAVTGQSASATIDVRRLDAGGGQLKGTFEYDPGGNVLVAQASYFEPAGGLVASAVGLQGSPDLALALDGRGPLDNWRAGLTASANGAVIARGTGLIARNGEALDINASLDANIGTLAPKPVMDLVAGDSRLAFDLVRLGDGSVDIQSMSYRSEKVRLSVNGMLAPDFFPVRGQASLTLSDGGSPMALPLANAPSLTGLAIDADLGGEAGDQWNVQISADQVRANLGMPLSPGGGLNTIGRIEINADGVAQSLKDPQARTTSFTARAQANALSLADAALARAIGAGIGLSMEGRYRAGSGVGVAASRLETDHGTVSFTGDVGPGGASGQLAAVIDDLSKFGDLAKRDIAGSVQADVDGSVVFQGQQFDLSINANAVDARLGIARLDELLAGTTSISGRIAGQSGTTEIDGLNLSGDAFDARVDGEISQSLGLTLDATVKDLARLSERAKGELSLAGTLSGLPDGLDVDLNISLANGMIGARPLAITKGLVQGRVTGPDPSAQAEITADLGGIALDMTGALSGSQDGSRRFDDLAVRAGENRLNGAIVQAADGTFSGRLDLDAPDLAVLVPLVGIQLAGQVQGAVELAPNPTGQSARISGMAQNVSAAGLAIGQADLTGTAEDLFGSPALSGRMTASAVAAGGMAFDTLSASARQSGRETAFQIAGSGPLAEADIAGRLVPETDGTMVIALERGEVSREGVSAQIAQPTSITLREGAAALDNFIVEAGGGRIVLDGTAGGQLNLDAKLEALPASLVNGFAPDLGASGILSGTVRARGAAADPSIEFAASWVDAGVAASRDAGVGTFTIDASGRYEDQLVNLDAKGSGRPGLSFDVAGTVPVTPGGALDLSANGTIPMVLLQQRLAERGISVTGGLTAALAISGPVGQPTLAGSISGSGIGIVDPGTGVTLTDIGLDVQLDGQRLVIARLQGRSGRSGTVEATGDIGIAPGSGFPLNIAIRIRDGRYVNDELIIADINGDITVTGPAIAGPTISGRIDLTRAEITVPENLGGGASGIDVRHVNAPAGVRQTLAIALPRAKPKPGAQPGSQSAGGANLDIELDAPARIFVRGRGLDLELGGRVRLAGSTSDIVATGGFELRRGRLNILAQRITIDHGLLDFEGDLDPILDFSGSTISNSYTITVTVTGRASDPKIGFQSAPALPEDEVLAQLLFGQSLNDLSPIQLVTLANAAAELGGLGSGGGPLQRLRAASGLDNLDVVADQEGNAAVRAGRYVSDNIYLGVEQGSGAQSSRVTIDLDINKDFKARGALGNDGESSIGVFFEREY